MLGPMRDAAALKIGVSHIPILTLVSTILALASSVPVGWLFEAPNPERSGLQWRGKVGLTRGETQGTSLALFLRCFAICLLGYAVSFKLIDLLGLGQNHSADHGENEKELYEILSWNEGEKIFGYAMRIASFLLGKFGKAFYVMFFLVVHLMKLHSISLMWGVTSEAMEYEEQAEIRSMRKEKSSDQVQKNGIKDKEGGGKSSSRLKRLGFVGFGGTLGGILGSVFVSMTAHTLHLSGLLIVASTLLFLSAELSIELGQIMLRHWQEEQNEFSSQEDLTTLLTSGDKGSDSNLSSSSTSSPIQDPIDREVDSSMKRVASIGSMKRVTSMSSMKRVASGVSMASVHSTSEFDSSMKKVGSVNSMKRVASGSSINNIRQAISSSSNLSSLDKGPPTQITDSSSAQPQITPIDAQSVEVVDDNSFKERLLRGVKTIIKSRLLMTIFTYNALYATTSVLLSFQRAELVASRSSDNTVDSNTAFLANVNIASSVAVFALQASGLGAFIANSLGLRGTLALMPMVRLLGLSILGSWHVKGGGKPPNLVLFLALDEFTKVINFAVAKPVRENLWRGLSNEARYEAKPIVDTLANRWGGGSAAFLIALLDRIMIFTGLGEQLPDGTKALFGFPPLLILCSFSALWWTIVSTDLGQIRHKIDLELKKQE